MGVPYPNNGGLGDLADLAAAVVVVVVGAGGFCCSILGAGGWGRGLSLAAGGLARRCGLLGARARWVGLALGLGLGVGLDVAWAAVRDAHGNSRGVLGAATKLM